MEPVSIPPAEGAVRGYAGKPRRRRHDVQTVRTLTLQELVQLLGAGGDLDDLSSPLVELRGRSETHRHQFGSLSLRKRRKWWTGVQEVREKKDGKGQGVKGRRRLRRKGGGAAEQNGRKSRRWGREDDGKEEEEDKKKVAGEWRAGWRVHEVKEMEEQDVEEKQGEEELEKEQEEKEKEEQEQ